MGASLQALNKPKIELKDNIIHIEVDNISTLYKIYMPYIKGGGLFIETPKAYKLDEEVKVSLSLLDEPTPLPFNGLVVWITPIGAQGGMPAGIGVQFNDDAQLIKSKIETFLAGTVHSESRTDTM